MNIVRLCRVATRRLTWLALGAALVQCSQAAVREETFDVLQTKTRAYTNVTVTTKTKSYIFIMHANGMGNIPLADLPAQILQKLGYAAAPESKTNSLSVSISRIASGIHLPPVKTFAQNWRKQLPAMAQIDLSSSDQYTVLAIIFGVYLAICYCLGSICRKAHSEPGFLVWLPVLQIFPMLRAARMTGAWFLAFSAPLIGAIALTFLWNAHVPAVELWTACIYAAVSLLAFVAWICWFVNIVKARGKSLWVALFLVLPVTNLFAFLYLAFSRSKPVLEAPRYHSMALQTA